jgi:hypothetical protein
MVYPDDLATEVLEAVRQLQLQQAPLTDVFFGGPPSAAVAIAGPSLFAYLSLNPGRLDVF